MLVLSAVVGAGSERSRMEPIEGGPVPSEVEGMPSARAGETPATQNKANRPGFSPDVAIAVEWANYRAQLKVEGKMPSARAGETPATRNKANL